MEEKPTFEIMLDIIDEMEVLADEIKTILEARNDNRAQ